jgi:hypothetical protein
MHDAEGIMAASAANTETVMVTAGGVPDGPRAAMRRARASGKRKR